MKCSGMVHLFVWLYNGEKTNITPVHEVPEFCKGYTWLRAIFLAGDVARA